MTVVVAYIPTPEGDAALDRAVLEAQVHGTDLIVFNTTPREALVHDRRLFDDQIEQLRARLDATGVSYTIERADAERHAADEIMAVASSAGADMIVLGLRRRSPTGKLIFGSTAQRVLLEADCAVVGVKAPHGS